MNDKCFKCGEPSRKSNECRTRKFVNLVKECLEDEDEDFEGVDIGEANGGLLNCVIHRILYTIKEKKPKSM